MTSQNSQPGRHPDVDAPLSGPRLEGAWRTLMGPLGFSCRRLWLLLVDAQDRPLEQLSSIDDLPVEGTPDGCAALMEMCRSVVDHVVPDGSIALLFSRPGRDPLGSGDVRWARSLVAAAREQQVPLWPIHFANDVELRVFPPEDVLLRAG